MYITYFFYRGEKAFYSLILGLGWAKSPLIKRMHKLDKNISITVLYGSDTVMDSQMGPRIKALRPDSFVDIKVITLHQLLGNPETYNCGSDFIIPTMSYH